MVHPCCGFSLQKATKIMAIIDVVQSGLSVLIFSIIILVELFGSSEGKDPEASYALPLFIIFVALLISGSDLYMSITLMQGADEKNLEKCDKWFKVKVALLILKVAVFLAVLTFSGFGRNGLLMKLPTFNIYPLYMLWVVYAFMQDLKEEGRTLDSYGAMP